MEVTSDPTEDDLDTPEIISLVRISWHSYRREGSPVVLQDTTMWLQLKTLTDAKAKAEIGDKFRINPGVPLSKYSE